MFENFEIDVCNSFKKAEKYRMLLNHEYVGTEHLLLAILKEDATLAKELQKFGLYFEKYYEDVAQMVMSSAKNTKTNEYTPLLKRIILAAQNSHEKVTNKDLLFHLLDVGEGVGIRILMNEDIDVDALYNFLRSDNTSLDLFKYGKCLNTEVSLEEKIVGRDKEINLIIETLLRKKKNNPLLVGEAGVGKSAIVEELARRIVKGDVPSDLLDLKIVSLDMGSVLAGTRYRGEFEERFTKIIEEAKNNANIILFIDEIHTLVGAGAAEGAIAASDIVKPYLARGGIKVLGATTSGEYEKTFCKDKALNRRFEVIFVKEPDRSETLNILKEVKKEYEEFHKVSIDEQTLEVLLDLSQTYFPSKKNPDKAIELLDSVMSYVRLKQRKNTIKEKELELNKVIVSKVKMLENGDFKEALKSNMLENKLKRDLNNLKSGKKLFVSKEDIIDVLEFKNNIILSKDKLKVCSDLSYKKAFGIVMKHMKNKSRALCFMVQGNNDFAKKLAKALDYDLFYLNNEEKINKLFNKVKYYPSSVIVTNNIHHYKIEKLFKTIVKDGLVENEDEYISFNNAILIIENNDQTLGFNNSYISEVPIDEIISFKVGEINV